MINKIRVRVRLVRVLGSLRDKVRLTVEFFMTMWMHDQQTYCQTSQSLGWLRDRVRLTQQWNFSGQCEYSMINKLRVRLVRVLGGLRLRDRVRLTVEFFMTMWIQYDQQIQSLTRQSLGQPKRQCNTKTVCVDFLRTMSISMINKLSSDSPELWMAWETK